LNDIGFIHFCDITPVDDEVWPVIGWTIDTSAGRVLVDTGLVEVRPEFDDWNVVLHPWPELGEIVAVINTHLHVDHCGANRQFAGTPTYVQRAELRAAKAPAYLEEWVHFPGESYVEVDGDAELFDGVSVLFTPGHSEGHQAVVVETDDGVVVLGGDVAVSLDELAGGATESIRRIHELTPKRVYITHAVEPWVP
jgi:N-acyl homoserine lactone hydrolase